MKVRKLNKEGIREFTGFVERLREGDSEEIPVQLLSDPTTSESVELDIELGNETFPTRYDLGEALVRAIGKQNLQQLIGDTGFWSWLALHWFDQLVPENSKGVRKPAMAYHYVLSPNYNHRYRHAIYTTWQLVSAYGSDARFLLCRPTAVRGELIEQMMARQYYLGCRGAMEAAGHLYWDPDKENFKRGAAARTSPGCVSRLVSWLQQLEVTYDVYSMTSEQLIALMPEEFNRFKEAA